MSHRLIHITPANKIEEDRLRQIAGMEAGTPTEEIIAGVFSRYNIRAILAKREDFKSVVSLMSTLAGAGITYSVG